MLASLKQKECTMEVESESLGGPARTGLSNLRRVIGN